MAPRKRREWRVGLEELERRIVMARSVTAPIGPGPIHIARSRPKPVNQPPVIGLPGDQTVGPGGELALSPASGNRITIADRDAGTKPVRLTLSATNGTVRLARAKGLAMPPVALSGASVLTVSGSLAKLNAALAGAVFTPLSGFTGTAELLVSANDLGHSGAGGPRTAEARLTIAVGTPKAPTPNDAPTVALPGPQSIVRDGTLVLSRAAGNAILVGDGDAGGSPIQVTLVASAGTVALASLGGVMLTDGNGHADTRLTLLGPIDAINSTLEGMTYTPTPGYVGGGSLQVIVNDQGNTGTGGPQYAVGSLAISVTAPASPNAPPTIALPGPLATPEGTPLVLSSASSSAIRIGDPDAGSNPVQVSLTASGGTIALANLAGLALLEGGGQSDARVTINGSLASINAALDGLGFTPSPGFSGAAGLAVEVDDLGSTGSGGPQFASAVLPISVAPAPNHPPRIMLPGAAVTPAGSSLVLSSARGNAITIEDDDAGSGAVQVGLTATGGTMALVSLAGLTLTEGTGRADVRVAFTGTLAAVDAALDGLVFTPDAGFGGIAGLRVDVDDLGHTGSGGPQTSSATLSIGVGAAPGSEVTLNATGLDPSLPTFAEFTDANGHTTEVAATSVSAGSITTVVPVYLALPANVTRETPVTSAGVFSVSIRQVAAAGPIDHPANDHFQVLDLPALTQPAGTLASEYLTDLHWSIATVMQDYRAIAGASNGAVNATALLAALQAADDATAKLRSAVDGLVAGTIASVDLGRINGVSVPLDAGSLPLMDELIANFLAVAGSPGGSNFGLMGPMFDCTDDSDTGLLRKQLDAQNLATRQGLEDIEKFGETVTLAAEGVAIATGNPEAVPAINKVGSLVSLGVAVGGTVVLAKAEAEANATIRANGGDASKTNFDQTLIFARKNATQKILESSIEKVLNKFETTSDLQEALKKIESSLGAEAAGELFDETDAKNEGKVSKAVDSNYGNIQNNLPQSASPGINVEAAGDPKTSSNGQLTATFQVSLASPPKCDVTVPIQSSDENEGTASPAQLVFTPSNWSVPQTVTITGNDRLKANGPVSYQVNVGPSQSMDKSYDGLTGSAVSVTNLHPGITLKADANLLTTSDGSQTASFTVVLDAPPTDTVQIAVKSDDVNEGTVSTSTLTFTPSNWDQPQTVTVTGNNNRPDEAGKDIPYRVEVGPAQSGDLDYKGTFPHPYFSVPLTNRHVRNDVADIRVTMTASEPTVRRNDTVTFTLTATNDGPAAATNVPIHFTNNGATGEITGATSTAGSPTFDILNVDLTVPRIAVGASVTVRVTMVVYSNALGDLDVVGYVLATAFDQEDPKPDNNSVELVLPLLLN